MMKLYLTSYQDELISAL